MAKVMVLGAGSFGTALALLCHRCGHEVTVWSHREEEANRLREEREQKKEKRKGKGGDEKSIDKQLRVARRKIDCACNNGMHSQQIWQVFRIVYISFYW